MSDITATTTDPPKPCMAARTSLAGGSCSPRTSTSVQNWKSRSAAISTAAAGTCTAEAPEPLASASGRMGSPSMYRTTPSIIRTKPLPPASTTPASFSTAISSGVRARATSPSASSRRMNSPTSPVSAAARSAAAAASRATVRIVPSRGSSSDS